MRKGVAQTSVGAHAEKGRRAPRRPLFSWWLKVWGGAGAGFAEGPEGRASPFRPWSAAPEVLASREPRMRNPGLHFQERGVCLWREPWADERGDRPCSPGADPQLFSPVLATTAKPAFLLLLHGGYRHRLSSPDAADGVRIEAPQREVFA